MKKTAFGKTADGKEISLYTFENENQVTMSVSDLGASLVSVCVPDKNGKQRDVVLGYENAEGYLKNGCFFGATIGRNGNRIDQAKFSIDGREYQLVQNEFENNLHSGPDGFDRMLWEVKAIDEEKCAITFRHFSPDGEKGFPGNFDICVTYTLTTENAVEIHYEGTTDADTVANMTNHTYFNLGGHDSGSVMEHLLCMRADYFTPVREKSIPTGEICSVKGTPMDFTTEKSMGKEIDAEYEQLKLTGGYDHNYVLDKEPGAYKAFATACHPGTGIAMEVSTDCPGVQFYAGNFIEECRGKEGVTYRKRHGFCLETQFYPNAVNEPGFPSPILKKGEKYDSVTAYRFFIR